MIISTRVCWSVFISSRNPGLSSSECLQFRYNLFNDKALRFYDANVAERSCELPEALQVMKALLNSASKQQRIRMEVSKLSHNSFPVNAGNHKRKAFMELKKHIKRRLALFPGTCRHESNEIGFYRRCAGEGRLGCEYSFKRWCIHFVGRSVY